MSGLSPEELLKAHGIDYVATKKGTYTTSCPSCSVGYLNVKLQGDGVVWFCQSCQRGGGDKYEQQDGGALGPIKATFDYHDEAGNRLFQVLRFEPVGKTKTFRQRTGPDQQKWSLKGVRRVLYRLPDLIEDIAKNRIVFVVEGEKDAESLRIRGVPATTKAMGFVSEEKQNKGTGWLPTYSDTLRGADVVICGDNDAQGREHVRVITRCLNGKAARVRVLDLKQFWPKIEESDDISDWFERGGGTAERLLEIVEQLPDYKPEGGGNGYDGALHEHAIEHVDSPSIAPDNQRAIQVVDGQIARIVDEAEAALLERGVSIMVRAGSLVQPIVDKLPSSGGRMTEVTLLRALRRENIIYLLNKAGVIFQKYDGRSKEWEETNPPSDVAGILLAKGQWQFHKVVGTITVPTLRPDGTILDRSGYDPATQLWYAADSSFTMPAISDRPTREDALQALALLEGLLTGFSFVADVDLSVALAAILTAILRGAFDVAPMTLIIAYEPGSGKTFLVNLISNMMRGQDCPVITACKSVEEMEKRLGALLLEGAPIINLDNASDNIGGDLLCQITEQRIVRIRILGRSEVPQCEWRGLMFATGNNVALVGDMTRRGLICNIDPGIERPELRKFAFNPIEQVLADRGRYVAAALTIARAYIAAGRPTPDGCLPLASYGAWSKAVREPLIWLDKEDPVKSMEQAREADPIRTAARSLVEMWKEHIGVNNIGYSAADLIKKVNEQTRVQTAPGVNEDEFSFPDFRNLLAQQAGTLRGEIDPHGLGRWLGSIRGQVHGGHRIVRAKETTRGHKYSLVALGTP